jgi:hypothetical protein
MGETEQMDDARFVDAILKSLPTMAVPAALEARILADFDHRAGRRRFGILGRVGERLWPGAPAWQPASVLALSLAAGLMVGVFVPSPTTTTTVATTTTESTAIAALDTVPEMGLDREQ